MPEGLIPEYIMHLFEDISCFDEFQHFGTDPDADLNGFDDIPEDVDLSFM